MKSFRDNFLFTMLLTAIVWIVWLYEQLSGNDLSMYGIIPHNVVGLRGVFFAPYLHGDLMHISSNTIPFIILMTVLLNAYSSISLFVLAALHLLTGFLVWLLSPPDTIHIGMSGVIYGMAGFLVGSGFFRKDLKAFAIAVFVILMYGGMIWGFLPAEGISWQSHFFGFLAGVVLSYFFRNKQRTDEAPELPYYDKEPRDERRFFEKHPYD